MNTETNRVYDVLVSEPNKGLRKVATAFPTPKGTGYRCTLKAAVPEGAQLVILPSRPKAEQSASTDDSADSPSD